MKFLLDQCLSPQLATLLSNAGHDAVHARDRGLSRAKDDDLIALAEKEVRILLTADTDFPSILTLGARRAPSCILFRGDFEPAATMQARLLLASLHDIAPQLERGALVVITTSKVRVRDLPVTDD